MYLPTSTRSLFDVREAKSLDDLAIQAEKWEPEQLRAAALNALLNSFLGEWADYGKDDRDRHGHGKRIPYIGWFWRYVNWASRSVPVGDCGDFVGFMENNKWGYGERDLTEDELNTVVGIVLDALREAGKGGEWIAIRDATAAKLEQLWVFMETLEGTIPAGESW